MSTAKQLVAEQAVTAPAVLGHCCHDVAKEVADAHGTRIGRVARLPKEFRQRLWEEIC